LFEKATAGIETVLSSKRGNIAQIVSEVKSALSENPP
jgi:hypothetical protein